MNIKIIAVDIDGTLLNSRHQLDEKTKGALIDVQKKGVRLVLASGRPTQGLTEIARQLEMQKHHGMLISYNGSIVTDYETNEILYQKQIPSARVKDVLNHLRSFDVGAMIDFKNTLYTEHYDYEKINVNGIVQNIVEMEARVSNFKIQRVDNLADFIDFPVPKILTFGDPDYLKTIYDKLKEPFKNSLNSMFTIPFYYEFTEKGIDKGVALYHLLEKLQISKDTLLAFGDNHNDLSMIELAGCGVAMGNAVDEVKATADEITDTNDAQGIVKTLKKKLLLSE